jgi:hypothetical protein
VLQLIEVRTAFPKCLEMHACLLRFPYACCSDETGTLETVGSLFLASTSRPHCAVENSSLFCDVVSLFSCLLLHVKSAGDTYRTVLHKSPALDLTSNNSFCGCVESKKVLKCSHRSVF